MSVGRQQTLLSARVPWPRRMAAVAAIVATLAACGHRMSQEELLAANGGGAGSTGGSSAAGRPGTQSGSVGDGSGDIGAGNASGGLNPSSGAGAQAGDPAAPTATASNGIACSTGDTSPLLIGSVGNYSGPAGASLAPAVKGLQLWAAWVNAHGGLCGRQVQIVVVDDHSDPAQYRAALQDLVENRHVVSFSNLAAVTGDAGVSYIESVHVPVIGTSGALPSEFASPMYFLGVAPNTDLVYATARIAAVFGPPSHRYGYISCREVAACGSAVDNAMTAPDGTQAAGVDVVYRGQASIAQPDYTSECQAAKGAGAEILSVFLDAASLRRFGRSCQRQGYQPVYAGIAGTIDTGLATEPGYGTILMVEPIFAFTDTTTAAQREFHDAIDALYGAPAGPSEAQGWTYGKMFEKAAIVAAQTTGTITSAALIDALHTFKDETFDGLTIPLTFPAGGPGIYPPCWFVARAHDGSWSTMNSGQPMCR